MIDGTNFDYYWISAAAAAVGTLVAVAAIHVLNVRERLRAIRAAHAPVRFADEVNRLTGTRCDCPRSHRRHHRCEPNKRGMIVLLCRRCDCGYAIAPQNAAYALKRIETVS